MMRLLLVTYQNAASAKTALDAHLRTAKAWWHFVDGTWFLWTDHTAACWCQQIRERVKDSNFRLLVAEVEIKDTNGWLPQEAWDWFKSLPKT